jgi:hypothetical protein
MARTASLPQATYSDTLAISGTNYAPSHIGNDPAAYLPPGAADRLRKLQQRADDLHALIPSFDDRHLANLAKAECQRRIDRLLEHGSRGGFGLAEDDGRVTAERRRLAGLGGEAARLESLYTARAAVFQAAGAVLTNVKTWLAEARGGLEDFETPAPTLQKGEDIKSAVDRLRGRVRELKTRLTEIERAPLPRALVRARIRQKVLELAAKGAPSIGSDGTISAASHRMSVPIIGGTRENPLTAIAHWEQPDMLALVAWLNPEAMIAALTGNEAADNSGAMTDEARRKALAETAAALLSAERTEAHFVWRGLDEGLPNIEFRPDTDVCAVLNVQVSQVSSALRALAAESSDDHSYGLAGRF